MNILQIAGEHRYDCNLTEKPKQSCFAGVVTDCCGAPIRGVCVKIITAGYEPVNHTITDECGAFTLIGEADDTAHLVFAKEGYTTLQMKSSGETLNVCLKREVITCVVSGKLLYKNCTPAAPAKVQLVNSSVSLWVFSKADGSFLFTRVPGGKYTLTISGNDCKRQSIYVTVPEHQSAYNICTIMVEQVNILCTVHGIVTDTNGKPIKNAVVVLMSCATKTPVSHTLTNENGLYFFGNIKNGCYYVEAFD